MNTITIRLLAALATSLALPAGAAVTFFDNQVLFDAASTTTLRATFEGFSHVVDTPGIANPYTEGGVTFFNPSNLYVATPGGAAAVTDIAFPFSSNVLTVSGNEDITMTFAGPVPTAMGFSSFTNRFDAPVVSVFDTSNVLIGSYVLTQLPDTAGFVGITSTVGIGSVRWLAHRGEDKDTAIDNIYVGQVPEPSTWLSMLAGAVLLGCAVRRQRMIASRAV